MPNQMRRLLPCLISAVASAALTVGTILLAQNYAASRATTSADTVSIHLRYTAGNWVNPDNRDETLTFPKRNGIVTPSEALITNNRGGGSAYPPSGGYIWAWNGRYEVRLLMGQAPSLSLYGGNGEYRAH
jgi:hypothetical protein